MLPPVLRRLIRTPSFTLLAVLTLALGIGANTAVFTVVDSVLLVPLPDEEPARLVGLWHEAPGLGFPQLNQAPGTCFTYREEQRTLVDIGIWDPSRAYVTGSGEPERVETMLVTDATLPLLGVEPARGRLFAPEDLALEYFDAPQDAVGRRIKEDWGEDTPWREVIGVVGPIRDDGLDRDPVPAIYWPIRVERFWGAETFMQRGNAFVVRSPRVGGPGFVAEVRSAVWSVDPDLPLSDVRTLRGILADSTARTTFTLLMLGLAAGMALVLASVAAANLLPARRAARIDPVRSLSE